jgi:hypothetical protein
MIMSETEYRQLDKEMKRLGDWFSKAADVKCTGKGGSIIILCVHYVRAQQDIIVVVVVATIQMKLVLKCRRFSNVTDK